MARFSEAAIEMNRLDEIRRIVQADPDFIPHNDAMKYVDCDLVQAGFEESENQASSENSVVYIVKWWSDCQDSRYL